MLQPFLRGLAVLGLVGYLLALSGCGAALVRVASLNPGENLAPSENRALVIGRIIQVENGTEQNMRNSWYGSPAITLYRVESREMYVSAVVADKDGHFYWFLPRGTYLMVRYQYHVPLPIAPRSAFQVPPGPGVVYIGTLRIEIDTVHGFLFLGRAQKGPERIAVLDEFEQAHGALGTRNPQLYQQVAKHPMVHSLLLPELPTIGSPPWQYIIRVLNELGLPILTTVH
jgi:hypothetical protein